MKKFFALRAALAAALFSLALSSAFSEKFDYDFSKMNYNMATAVVFDMMVSPGDYENKSVKIFIQLSQFFPAVIKSVVKPQ